jgi:2-polyprenyl-3-methyl-5-hydroxy-6-metoxy-1,4-benzoquinol methylase
LDSLNVSGKERVIDVGCGDGELLLDLAELGCTSAGVDAASELAKKAQARLGKWPNVRIYSGRFEVLPWRDCERFDILLAKNVLHLVRDLALFFRTAKEVLSTSGRLGFIETVSPTVEANNFVRELFTIAGLRHTKAHYFNKHDLAAVLAECGCYVSEVRFSEESILLEEWLRAKRVSDQNIIECRRLVEGLSTDLKRTMKITRDARNDDWRLLRLQSIVIATVSQKSVQLSYISSATRSPEKQTDGPFHGAKRTHIQKEAVCLLRATRPPAFEGVCGPSLTHKSLHIHAHSEAPNTHQT